MTVVFPRKGIRHLVSGFGQWFLLLEVAESGAVNQLCAAEASPGGAAARQRWQPSTPMGFFAVLEDRKRWNANAKLVFWKHVSRCEWKCRSFPRCRNMTREEKEKRRWSILGIVGSCSISGWYFNCLIFLGLHALQPSKEVRVLQHQVLSLDLATIKLGIHQNQVSALTFT